MEKESIYYLLHEGSITKEDLELLRDEFLDYKEYILYENDCRDDMKTLNMDSMITILNLGIKYKSEFEQIDISDLNSTYPKIFKLFDDNVNNLLYSA